MSDDSEHWKALRSWNQAQRVDRLRALGVLFREADSQSIQIDPKAIDESVLLWLEVMREAYPGDRPRDKLHELIMRYSDPGPAFSTMSLRFLESLDIMIAFEKGDRITKNRLRPALIGRGLL